jgi:hypothetical protein
MGICVYCAHIIKVLLRFNAPYLFISYHVTPLFQIVNYENSTSRLWIIFETHGAPIKTDTPTSPSIYPKINTRKLETPWTSFNEILS